MRNLLPIPGSSEPQACNFQHHMVPEDTGIDAGCGSVVHSVCSSRTRDQGMGTGGLRDRDPASFLSHPLSADAARYRRNPIGGNR